MNIRPLDGIRVVDLTQFLSGPFSTHILGDLGAEIIKIERPPFGDNTRTDIPTKAGSSAMYAAVNRGKKSIALNLKKPEHKAILIELIKTADVLVENFKPGALKRMNLDYGEVRKIKEDIIYLSISGYGQTGPYSERGALDISIQAQSGFMSTTGPKGGEPTKAGPSLSDTVAGFYGVIAVMAAIMYKEKTGKGQYLDVSMLDCMMSSIMLVPYARYKLNGVIPRPQGNRHPASTPFQMFETADGSVVVCCPTNDQFRSLMEGLGHLEIYNDSRFTDTKERYPNKDQLEEVLVPIFKEWKTKDIVSMMTERKLPFGQIKNMEELCSDEQLLSRNVFVPVYDDLAGRFDSCAFPVKMSEIEYPTSYHSPQIGEDTYTILKNILGKSEEEIKALYND